MNSGAGLIGLFQAMSQNLKRERQRLNALDSHDSNIGDTMTANLQLVTDVLRCKLDGRWEDTGAALLGRLFERQDEPRVLSSPGETQRF